MMINFIKNIISLFAHINFLDQMLYQLELYKHKPLNFQVIYTNIYINSFNTYQKDVDKVFEEVGL